MYLWRIDLAIWEGIRRIILSHLLLGYPTKQPRILKMGKGKRFNKRLQLLITPRTIQNFPYSVARRRLERRAAQLCKHQQRCILWYSVEPKVRFRKDTNYLFPSVLLHVKLLIGMILGTTGRNEHGQGLLDARDQRRVGRGHRCQIFFRIDDRLALLSLCHQVQQVLSSQNKFQTASCLFQKTPILTAPLQRLSSPPATIILIIFGTLIVRKCPQDKVILLKYFNVNQVLWKRKLMKGILECQRLLLALGLSQIDLYEPNSQPATDNIWPAYTLASPLYSRLDRDTLGASLLVLYIPILGPLVTLSSG